MRFGLYTLLFAFAITSCSDNAPSKSDNPVKLEKKKQKIEDVEVDTPSSDEWHLVTMTNGNMGYSTADDQVMLEGDWTFCRLFKDNYAAVRKRVEGDIYGRMGLIDEKGKAVVPFEYNYVSDFGDGLVAVRKDRNGKVAYVNLKNEEVVEAKYDMGFAFSSKRARVAVGTYYDNLNMQRYNNCKYGFINEKGEEVIPAEYDWAGDFAEGIAPVSKNGRYFFIDPDGNKVDNKTYSRLSGFKGELCWVKKGNKGGFINKDNEVVIPLQYDNYMYFFTRGSRFTSLDMESEIGETRFQTEDGFFFVSKNRKFGIITIDNEVKTPFNYTEIELPKDGYVEFKKGSKSGLGRYKDGVVTEILPAKYDYIFHYGDQNFIQVGQGDFTNRKVGAYDLKGNELIPIKYEDVEDIDDDHKFFGVKIGDKWAIIDADGKLITKAKYDYVGDQRDNGTFYVTEGDYIIYVDQSGKEVERKKK